QNGRVGKTIKDIQEETGAKLDVDDNGLVYVSHMDAEKAEMARAKFEALTEEIRVGRVYGGKVTSIKDFGAFIEIAPGRDGLCHISELDDKYVGKVDEVCKVGDVLRVKVISIDDQDRVKLSRKVILREENPDAAAAEAAAHPRRDRPEGER